ncbi:MAG: biopolymer transporter ExbD [Bdellovibrionales bacterium]|nr:biopolymer transporter ExbD [Bdellovibrionales bacterium]
MAAKLGGGSAAEESGPISDINVTPFVDVVLVLLVIFMVTAPILVKDSFGIKLPKAANTEQTSKPSTLGLSVTRQGQILLNGNVITDEALKDSAKAALAQDPESQAIISADQDARHADVVRAIDLVKGAGISKFALQIERQSP